MTHIDHPFEIIFYKKVDATCPIQDFLDSLELKLRAKALRLILLLAQNGNNLREPYSKYLDDGLFELRIKQGSNIIRIIYFYITGSKIILTNGFVKKTLKLPRKELHLAKIYHADYLERSNTHE